MESKVYPVPKKYTLSSRGVDKYLLYQWSVQDADETVELTVEQYERRRNRKPLVLREDFCGTALVASRWVRGHSKRRAIGLDLDAATLEWAREHNVNPLGQARRQVDLRQRDVRSVTTPKADVVQAFNFSYYLLHPLSELIDYFRSARRSLAPGGMILLDCYGGSENHDEQRYPRTVTTPRGTFGFVWEQAIYNPIDNRAQCYIHFELATGERWEKAFYYDFRLYSPAEVSDALKIAGFSNIEILWDFGVDENVSEYRPADQAENCPCWIAYIIADR